VSTGGCTPEALIEFLKTRRSIRRFKQQPPPLSLILQAIDTARFAPSARNSQPWVFIIVTDPAVREKLAQARPPPPDPARPKPLLEAPLVVVIAVNKDEDPMFHKYDGALAAAYFMLAAHALGLGTVWVGIGTEQEIRAVRRAVNLPDSYLPVALIPVGYPDEKPEPRPRKPIEEITRYNIFQVNVA